MKSAIIYVFSGTGNTLLTANMLCRHLESRGVKTQIHSIKKGEPSPPPSAFDLIGFAYPVYAYNIPETFWKFVRDMHSVTGKKAFIMKTSGEPFRLNAVSSYKLVKALDKKGFGVVLEQHLLMPYNILFRYPDSLAKQMYLYSDSLCEMLAKRLTAGERDRLRFNPLHIFASLLLRAQWPGARLNGRVYSVNKKKCIKCMRCVRDCPEGNITYKEGKFRFGWSCTMCMRCAMLCPSDAINVGLIRFFKVHGAFDFKRILGDPGIPSCHVHPQTKGYFRLFRKFFSKADAALKKYDIDIPVEYDAVDMPENYDQGQDATQ